MEIKLNPILLSIVFVSLLALVFLGFYSFTKENKKHASETQALLDRLSDYESTNANLKIKSTSLENLIEKTEEENILLLKQIADLKKQIAKCFEGEDAKEGISAFLEKRKPNWD